MAFFLSGLEPPHSGSMDVNMARTVGIGNQSYGDLIEKYVLKLTNRETIRGR